MEDTSDYFGWNMSTTIAPNMTGSNSIKDMKMDSNFLFLLSSLLFALAWVVYITYYNARVFGYIITKVVNKLFIREGFFKIGSLSFNALSGKIMFRDVVYITHDYTVRVQDGYLIFRWWRAYVPKDVSEDLSHSDTRLSVMLNGFEVHVYNRSLVYSRLEEIFGLPSNIFPDKSNFSSDDLKTTENTNNSESVENSSVRKPRPEAALARTWRDLIPVIKCDISSSRVVFGNKLIPTTLSIIFEESHFVYSTKPAVCTLDRFMHFVKCKAENVRVMLAPSLKYTGMVDEPPRYMGEGFVLMSSNDLELYFYMDEPGLVPEEPVLITLPNGDVVPCGAPKWGVDIKCGKGTDFSYGPWADRQREHLFKFFYPPDYLPMEVTKALKPGDKREMESFDVRLLMQNEGTIDILFTKEKETNAVHLNVGAGSYLEVTVPWVTNEEGYVTKINGQLLHLESTTSLQFRDFIKSETLEFKLDCHYPLVWNDHQLWEINLKACKATVQVIFFHKWFFQDLINDWASKQRPDILHFVPYTWRFGITLNHCELLTLVNQYNWIDCSSVGQRNRLENTQLGLCAYSMHMSFDLPFDEFLPETIPLTFGIQGESIDLSLFIPEFHTSRNILFGLEKYAKILSKDGTTNKNTEHIPKWRHICQNSMGWIDFWWVPIGAISIVYTYHPAPPLGPKPQADISTPVKEEILLSPMRFPRNKKNRQLAPECKFDPTTLKPDTVNVELEIGPSVLLLYGTALKNFMNFKENIFGEDQVFTEMKSNMSENIDNDLKSTDSSLNLPLELRDDFDRRNYRPLEVDVYIVTHDVQAHLLKNCTEKDPPCPVILVERFAFEMKKRYDQTELQILLSPTVLLVSDTLNRQSKDSHLNQGKLTLSSLQVRGHAMFSDVGKSLDQDTLEYAWLIEVQIGKLSGKITTPQLYSIMACLETLILLLLDNENELNSPKDDSLLSRPVAPKKSIVSTHNLQQALQQLLQPKNSNTNVTSRSTLILQGNLMQGKNALNKDRESKGNLKSDLEKRKTDDFDKKSSVRNTISSQNQNNENLVENMDAHKLKYKFCRVAVDAIDFWLVESGTALQLWVSPLRLSTCNLHGKQVNNGLSCVLYSTSIRQLIWQPQKYNHTKAINDVPDVWIEVGAINLGPLIMESATSDTKELNNRNQQKFLKTHDDRWKKLWFLWPELNKTSGKCGCTGGCSFFGNNKNGLRFFKPSKKDLEDGYNVACFRVNNPGKDPGFGQSILHEGLLIFRTTPYIMNKIILQDIFRIKKNMNDVENIKNDETDFGTNLGMPEKVLERKVSRRFSSSSIRGGVVKEVPYARLVETAQTIIPNKLESDSKLHKEKTKLKVGNASMDILPKNSSSDSKLAVDYFNSSKQQDLKLPNSAPASDLAVSPQFTVKNFATSDSHYSLNTRESSEERLQKNIERTTSMSSENHSETFFSADEEFNLNSRSSSLRNSTLSASGGGILPVKPEILSVTPARKKYSSEFSILARDKGAPFRGQSPPGSAPQTVRLGLSSHRSDHEIHTPEHRYINSQLNTDLRTVQNLATPQRNPVHRTPSPLIAPQMGPHKEPSDLESSDSNSLKADSISSTGSDFASAQGSQEDFTLVDLHLQVNRLIVDSPMLMSSYVTHLTQLKCSNWAQNSENLHGNQFSVNLFDENEKNQLVYSGGRFVPFMENLTEGITSFKMVSKSENANVKTPTSPFVYAWEQDESENDVFSNEEELLSNQNNSGSRTTIIVKIKGDFDIVISPLLLESLQRFTDSLTPTVANLHPLTVVNHLHTSCVGQVESANILQTTENVAKFCNPPTNVEDANTSELCRLEENVKTQLQAAIFLPKVNVTLLQVSIVEEIISFSALDNIKDLTCVSLFTVSFDNISAKLHCDKQACEVLQKFHRPSVVQTGSKKGANKAKLLLGLHTNTNADIIQGEPVYIETCEKLQQQLVVCLNIGKAHAQLRRLRNECSLLDDANITAIPTYKSKVLFTPAKVTPIFRGIEYYLQNNIKEQDVSSSDQDFSEEKLGFIMFEGGLEGITLKIIKKSQFEQIDSKLTVKCEIESESVKSQENIDSKSANVTPRMGDKSENTPKMPKKESTPRESRKSENDKNVEVNNNLKNANVSSCTIDLKIVWFNFAAPPRAPITRKIDYTRLDWNLLSTASPAINAWMNPSNRLAIRVVHMVRTMYRRSTATVACLMAEALDIQRVHGLTKSKYGKLTPLAQTLQDDPSLQLCSVLQKYYLEMGANIVESNLKESEVPQLFTLRQGIIVLSRQWKTILYTALLPQQSLKSKVKPPNVAVSINDMEEEIILTDGEGSGNEENDITDEHARLLRSGLIPKTTPHKTLGYMDASQMPQVAVVSGGVESILTSPSPPVPHKRRKKSLQPGILQNSSRTSVVLPLLQSNPLFSTKKDEDKTIITIMGSDPSEIGSSSEIPSPTHKNLGHTHSSEDLYSWMAKQNTTTNLEGCLESKIDTLQTESSGEGGTLPKEEVLPPEISLVPIYDSARLLDANQIFQPLLSSLGVMPQQLRFTTMTESGAGSEITTLDALGSNFCLVGNMNTMKIDIVVSEADNIKMEKKKAKNKSKKLFIDTSIDESPAFLCDKISVEIEVERMTDMAVNEIMKTKNVLYISRGQLKNHTSTVINFTIGVHYISQKVNMPLLRLLHQISNMYQNVKDTQNELREQQPVDLRRPKTSASDHIDLKNNSSISVMDNHDFGKPLQLKISDPTNFASQKLIISPSPSLRSRPQSFAQKLISTSKTVKGYVNLNDGIGTPVTVSSVSNNSGLEHITISSEKSMAINNNSGNNNNINTGRCWKTIDHLLDLYANMPDSKTIKHRFSVGTCDISEHYKGNRKYDILTEIRGSEAGDTPLGTHKEYQSLTRSNEHSKLIVFGVARIHRTKLLATLSGLKLEGEITNLHSSLTCRKRSTLLECSLTGQVGQTRLVLLEGSAPLTVVKVTIGKSQTLYSSTSRRNKNKNAGLLTIGAVTIDIPQHPVALHDMMTRSSTLISTTLQELRVTRTASRMSRVPPEEEAPSPKNLSQTEETEPMFVNKDSTAEKGLFQPLVMQFSVILQSFSINAALLPSLQAQYKMDQVNSTGFTGSKAKFTIDLPHHTLSFTTKLQGYNEPKEANLPSEASIALPAIHVSAEYIPENATTLGVGGAAEGVVFRQGGYLNAHADIGVFEHSLTTDLLNHLVFVQKVFMKEVNEVVQKVYGGERVVPLWLDDTEEQSSMTRILFSLVIKIQGIQLTATTAGSSAVRLETGEVVFEISNRIQNVSGSATSKSTAARLFGKAQVDLKLSLGQLIRNAIFEEAEIDFQPVAFFNTRIGLRNAFQDEIIEGDDKEVVLLTLKRPLVYIQPVAVDKAILVWLNYKNAYDYWNEKRANLNKEVLSATQQVYEKFQIGQLTSQLGSPHLGTLFLQLTIEDMGICLPLNPLPIAFNHRSFYEESRGAVVVTLENTSISACSSGSLVSKGKFSNLCLRFADDFENSLDDWKPDLNDSSIMNTCIVSDGTYEICSRTIAAKQPNENAKWFLNVQWQMEGVDIHLDTKVGTQLSALGHTLTTLTGAEEPNFPLDYDSDDNEPLDGVKASQESILPSFIFDQKMDNKMRSKLIEKEMNEQVKVINDLRSLGASHGTVEYELKKLHELEAMVYKDFRRDMMQKLRRQSMRSVRTSSIKDKFGLGSKNNRSKSFVQPSNTEMDSPESMIINSASSESSPRSGPSRTSSMKVKSKVTFSEDVGRQISLPSASSELSLPESPESEWGEQIHVDGEEVLLRKKKINESNETMDFYEQTPPFLNNTTLSSSQMHQEPNVDLELDVKVFINSGKCVLHTKDQVREEELKLNRMKKDRSHSAGLLDFGQNSNTSPDTSRKNKDMKSQFSTSRLRNNPHAFDFTIFHIPGMDVRIHYLSKVISSDLGNADLSGTPDFEKAFNNSPRSFSYTFSQPNGQETEQNRIDKAFKRQESQPTESVSLCSDFLSHEIKSSSSLHGITNPNYSPSSSSTKIPNLDDFQKNTPNSTFESSRPSFANTSRKPGIKKAQLFAWMTLQSVPEETMISPHILEFLEQTLEPIPTKTFNTETSLLSSEEDGTNYENYVYASFPVDVIVYFHMQPSTFRFSCLPVSRVECLLQLPSLDIVFSSKRAEDELLYSEFGDGSQPNTAATAIGGLSVTGCLSDFSVYIFHPYGGKKSALKEAQWSPLADSERKDSLSINVEFVKFHLSRSRMLNFKQETSSKGFKTPSDQSRAVIRFSTIVDIGSASFKYDMRRLTEILAFPKAWYRRSIVRRMFLGDLSFSGGTHTDDSTDNSGFSSFGHRTGERSSKNDKSPQMSKDKVRFSSDYDHNKAKMLREMGKTFSIDSNQQDNNENKNVTAWETLVLFGVNFKKLNVHMNMGNVMGNVSWLTKNFRSDGRLSIGSSGYKNLYIALGLEGSGLDAKGGIVGGNIEIANIDTYVHIREEPNVEPHHTMGLRLHALELRLDYMATSVLMCRVSDLSVNLRDEWKLDRTTGRDSFVGSKRPAMIFMHGNLGWDQLQMMISKNTTADLLKMFNKLEEFFSQQFNSSKRAFSFAVTAKRAQKLKENTANAQNPSSSNASSDAKHHRHWQRVLANVARLKLSTMHVPLPPHGTVLGGTMELHGSNISLACFHGINFKSKSWALFSLKEPCISFNAEAQEILSKTESEAHDVHIIQTLICSLGSSTYKTHLSMATVCKVSRSVIFPPQFRTLQEWFHYAFANSQIDEVDKFPSLEREKEKVDTNSMERTRGGSMTTSQKLADPNHNREVIFAVPSLQLHLKSEHLQTAKVPELEEEKPTVECSFITEFEDHIFVTVDAEAFFFLHDLITSYVKEKEKVLGSGDKKTPSEKAQSAEIKKQASTDIFANDFRNYECKTWHLEPTVRLLSVAGKYIEPYGIDYILQKLGFSHARITIPKWTQRGFMDPIDASLALLTLRMVQVVKGDSNKGEKSEKLDVKKF